jgi:hypothetical protein
MASIARKFPACGRALGHLVVDEHQAAVLVPARATAPSARPCRRLQIRLPSAVRRWPRPNQQSTNARTSGSSAVSPGPASTRLLSAFAIAPGIPSSCVANPLRGPGFVNRTNPNSTLVMLFALFLAATRSSLLAGDPVFVALEALVVGHREVVELPAALEVRHRSSPLLVWSLAFTFPTPCGYFALPLL